MKTIKKPIKMNPQESQQTLLYDSANLRNF